MATNAEKGSAQRNSAGLGRPLRVPIFRSLLIADLISDIGTFMQSVGAAWLMVSLRAGPGYVALIQTAASLPYFLLALPAGSAGEKTPVPLPNVDPVVGAPPPKKNWPLMAEVLKELSVCC